MHGREILRQYRLLFTAVQEQDKQMYLQWDALWFVCTCTSEEIVVLRWVIIMPSSHNEIQDLYPRATSVGIGSCIFTTLVLVLLLP